MESIFLLAAIFCIFYIIYWSIRNDSVSSIEEQTGYLKMRPHDAKESRKDRRNP